MSNSVRKRGLKMTGTKYLSEIGLTPNRFYQYKINVIECPTGSGKTFFALNVLPTWANSNYCVLYITDTRMNRDQLISNYDNTTDYSKEIRNFINGNSKAQIIAHGKRYQNVVGWGTLENTNAKIMVMTYAMVGAILHYGHDFDWTKYDYIICDELDNMINFQNIKVKGQSINLLDYTKKQISHIQHHHPDVRFVALSATPGKIYKHFKNTLKVLDPRERMELREYTADMTYYYNDYVSMLESISQGTRGIIYFTRIETIKKAESILKANGHKIGSFWSDKNEARPMETPQKTLRQYIIDNEYIPDNIDILLFNAACRSGVNIKNDDMDFMMIHATDGDTVKQVAGRLRNDISRRFLYSKTFQAPSTVPDEYLNRPLTTKEKAKLCQIIALWNYKTSSYRTWGTVIVEHLKASGYEVLNSSRNAIIKKI